MECTKVMATTSDFQGLDLPTRISKQEPPTAYQEMLEWNSDPIHTVNKCAHELINARTQEQPTSTAVSSWDGEFNYGELDQLSSRLGHYLSTQGVKAEVIVPLIFEKSKWTIVALLAVLKAGGAFVLLDPSQPVARLKALILQTGAKIALCSAENSQACTDLGIHILEVSAKTMEGYQSDSALPLVSPQNAAYVIFTSGSTGEPKGVVIEHSQVCTGSTNCGEALGFRGKPRVLQFASYSFDACILEILTTLIFGGTICIPSEWERRNALTEAMVRLNVTWALFTPSLLANLDLEQVTTLETLVIGGEKVPSSIVDFWASKIRLMLAYGPTECTVVACVLDANRQTPIEGDIGKPLGCHAWIVSEDDPNTLAEIGEVGELLLEGPIVARGYLNDKVKTDVQFITSPDWIHLEEGQPPRRFYRTGDLASFGKDGIINFVGRADGQIKIRGQRLELEEVASQLQYCISKLESVESKHILVEAIQPRGSAGSPLLIAFLHLKTSQSVGYLDWSQDGGAVSIVSDEERTSLVILATQIEAMLKLSLPVYALPSFYVPLREIPFAPSGKTDRKRLRELVAALSLQELRIFSTQATQLDITFQQSSQLPPIGQQLRVSWAEVFAIEIASINPSDHFLSLGGDSILAIGLVKAARAAGLNITFELIFRHPILSDMAMVTSRLTKLEHFVSSIRPFALLDSHTQAKQLSKDMAKQCNTEEDLIEDILPVSPMQWALWALSMKTPRAYIMHLVYSLPANLEIKRFEAAWSTVVLRNPILRTRFIQGETELLQVVVKESFQLGIESHISVEELVAVQTNTDMLLGQPLSRWTIVTESDPTQYHLVWMIHHSLIDGASASQIATEVEQVYFGNGLSPTPGFNTFIKYLGNQDKEAAKNFWRDQLVDAPASTFPPLPPNYQPIAQSFLSYELPRFPKTSFTTATMIQGAWSLLVGLYSSSTDVITGITLSGRTAQVPGVLNLVGPTITTVPFRTRFSREEPVFEFLQSIQDTYLDIIPFEQLGLQEIRHLSNDAKEACNFQNLLVIQPADEVPRELLLDRRYEYSSLDYAIVLECDLGERLKLRATFDDQVVHPSQVERIFLQLQHILCQLSLADASSKVSDLQVICDTDFQQLIAWNADYDIPDTLDEWIHDLVTLVRDRYENTGKASIWITNPDAVDTLSPIGTIGEILVAASQLEGEPIVAEDQDNSPFIENPSWAKTLTWTETPRRFYRTGDLGYHTHDGKIVFVGRKDVPSKPKRPTLEAEDSSSTATAIYVRPFTEMESQLRALWSDVLQTDNIGHDDDFFRLGGDSILSMRLVTMARKKGIAISVSLIAQHPTLEGLAEAASFDNITEAALAPFELVKGLEISNLFCEASLQCKVGQDQIEDIYPTTPLQALFMAPQGIGHFQAQIVFTLPPSLNIERFRAALHSIIQTQPILRTRIIYVPETGFFSAVIKEEPEFINTTSLEDYQEEDKKDLMTLGKRLQRYCIAEDKDSEKRYFVWSANHASYDGWMVWLLFKQLESAYLGEPQPTLLKFNKFIHHLSKLDVDASKEFWRSYLSGVVNKALFTLPPNFKPGGLIESVRTVSRPKAADSEISVYTMIELAWSIVVSRATGCEDVVMSNLRSGRNAPVPGIEDILGPTMCHVPMRISVPPDFTIRQLLRAIQADRLRTAPHEHLGYANISTLSPEIREVCRNAAGVNILPKEERGLGSRIGMEVVREYMSFRLPFFVECHVGDAEIELRLASNEAVVGVETREKWMWEFEYVLGIVMGAEDKQELRVRDIDFEGVERGDWSCVRRVSHYD